MRKRQHQELSIQSMLRRGDGGTRTVSHTENAIESLRNRYNLSANFNCKIEFA